MSNDFNENDELSEEEREKLRLENEILKLKMQAQFGAMFGGDGSEEFTPEMEHAFLKNVLAFEEQYQNRKMITVYDLLGKPAYKKFEQLQPDELKPALIALFELMKEKNVELHVRAKYEPSIIYKFITEELFEHETDDMQMEGMIQNFTYEEFHPNHKLDIEEQTMAFLKNWFEQNFAANNTILADTLFLLTDPSKPPVYISKEEVAERMQMIFDSYEKFDDCKLALMDISFQWDDTNDRGMGYSEGGVKYNAVMENGEAEKIEGPFKLYFSCEYGLWQVMHFVFPQFKWPNE
jgi:hypothetical protein